MLYAGRLAPEATGREAFVLRRAADETLDGALSCVLLAFEEEPWENP